MDYKTKPTSREELSGIARFVRKLFKCKNKYRLDVMDDKEHYLVKEIAYHPEPSLTGNHKPVLHVHEYKRDNFSERKPRLLTKYEYEKYKKYFKGAN